MKLNEIIDLKAREIYNSPKSAEEYLKQEKSEKKGTFSWVEDDEDPFLVRKKHLTPKHDPEETDGFYVYLNKIKNKMAENPFFPRVYEVEKHYDSAPGNEWSKSRINSKVEKLFPLSQLTHAMQDILADQLFDVDTFISYLSSNAATRDLYGDSIADIKEYAEKRNLTLNLGVFIVFLRKIKYYNENIWAPLIKNKKLKEALNLILDSKRIVDLHFDNIMFRRTPHGPQLVLSDPLSY